MKEYLKNISPFNNRTDMTTSSFILKKVLAFWFCYIAGLFIGEGVMILLHFALGKNMLVGETFDPQTITLMMYYGYIVVIAITLLYWKFIEKKPLFAMGITKRMGSYFVGVAVGVLLLAVSLAVILMTGSIIYQGVYENINIPVILLFFGGFIIQGAMEEILCRGLILHALKEKTSIAAAVAVSTLWFIVPHWSSLFEGEIIYGIIGVVNLILISLIFSALTIRTGSIWAACGLHSFWNAILYSVLGLNLSGNDETVTAIFNLRSVGENIWNGGLYGIEASVITTVVLALAAVCLSLWKMKKQ